MSVLTGTLSEWRGVVLVLVACYSTPTCVWVCVCVCVENCLLVKLINYILTYHYEINVSAFLDAAIHMLTDFLYFQNKLSGVKLYTIPNSS